MKNILPTPSLPGFLSQENHHSWFLEKPLEIFQAKHVSANILILVVGVLLHCPAARKLCSGEERRSGGRGTGLWCSLLSVCGLWCSLLSELSPPQFTGVDTEARGGRVAQLPSSLEPGLLSDTILVLLPAPNGVGLDSPLRVFNSAFSLLCRRGSELPCAHPLLLALFSSLKEASASETSLCPPGERERAELLLLDAGWNFTGSLGL